MSQHADQLDQKSKENKATEARSGQANYQFGVGYQFGVDHQFSTESDGRHIHVSFDVVTDVNHAVLRYVHNRKRPVRINYTDGSTRDFAYDELDRPSFVREASGLCWTRQNAPDSLGFAEWKSDEGQAFSGATFVANDGTYAYVDRDGLLCIVGTDCQHRYSIYEGSGDPFVKLEQKPVQPAADAPVHQQEVRAMLSRLFRSLDKDADGFIRKTDLDAAVSDDTMHGDQAKLIALLKLNYDKLSQPRTESPEHEELQLGSWLKANFDRLLALGAGNRLSLDEVVALSDLISQHKAVRPTSAPPQKKVPLYAAASQFASIAPQAVRQGRVGDCIFLAALSSIAASNPQMISRMIAESKDGKYVVTFPGAGDEPLVVPPPTEVELTLYAHATEYGVWPAVLEKAYGLYLAKHGEMRSSIPSENIRGQDCAFEALDLLTGQMGRWDRIAHLSEVALAATLSSAFAELRAIVAASSSGGRDGRTADAGIPANHAYGVLGFDTSSATVTLRNPWGEQQAPGQAGNGTFPLSLARFRRNFTHIYCELWAPVAGITERRPFTGPQPLVGKRNKR